MVLLDNIGREKREVDIKGLTPAVLLEELGEVMETLFTLLRFELEVLKKIFAVHNFMIFMTYRFFIRVSFPPEESEVMLPTNPNAPLPSVAK